MANKKAKTSKKKVTPVNKRTAVRVVSTKELKTKAKDSSVNHVDVDENASKNHIKYVESTTNDSGNVFEKFFRFLTTGDTVRMMTLELIGTFVVAVTFMFTQGHPMYVMFSVLAVYLVLSHKHGGAFNPALSFGAWITRKISGAAAIVQVVAQFLGAMLALIAVENFSKAAGSTVQIFQAQNVSTGKEWYVFIAELIGVMLLGLFLSRVSKVKNSNSIEKALGMAGIFFIAMLLAGQFASYASSTSLLNPSLILPLKVSFTNETWTWGLLIYTVAPLIGGALGFILGNLLQEKNIEEK